MADWYGTARSNYFAVRDEPRFRDELAREFPEVDVNEQDSRFALFARTDKGDFPSFREDENGDDVELDIVTFVSGHLADDEVAVFMIAGAEKLRYVTGNAVAVNANGDIKQISLDEIYELAKSLGSNITTAEY